MARRKRSRSSKRRSKSRVQPFRKINISVPKPLVAVTSIIVLLMFCWIPIRWGLADVYAYQARYQWQKWQQDAHAELALWLAARDHLRRAIRLNPKNAEYLESMGRLYEEKGRHSSALDGESNPFLVESVNYFEQSLKLRPGSAMTWANLALAHYQLNQLGGPFRHALHRAVSLGSWEPGVLDIVSDVGLGAWSSVAPETQQLVTENIKRQARHRAPQLWNSAQVHDQIDLVCGTLSVQILLEHYCPSRFSERNEEVKEEIETQREQEALPPIELEFQGIME